MSTRLPRLRQLKIVGLALGAVAVAGAAVVVTASAAGLSIRLNKPSAPAQPAAAGSTAELESTRASVCGAFMAHFAVDIGKSQAQINAAFQKAIADTLADEVKSGQITQAQADSLQKKFATATPCTLPSSLAPHAGKAPTLSAYVKQYEAAAAAALGITPAQLKSDLEEGRSLSQIAAAQKVSEADFRSRLVKNLQPVLDAAVKSNKLTAAQEKAIIKQLQTGPLPYWTQPAHKPKATASPAPSAA